MTERLERWTCNSMAPSSSPALPLAGSVLSSPEFKSSTTLVNNQLVCLRLVGILIPIMLDLN